LFVLFIVYRYYKKMEKKRYGVKTSLLKEPRQLSLKKKRKILSKRNFFDFESSGTVISRFPMTLMKSMVSLHQGPKVSKAKPLNM
jgi:hypothetical protein